jgi:C4-dicarboxylate-specific signal transduction histidine kinase
MRRGGGRFSVRHHPAPLRDAQGILQGFVASFEDITSLKEMERIALVQEKLASLGQVATGVAHEIRNPLSGINLYLHSLEAFLGEWKIPNPEIRETTEAVITSMKAASARMEAVIQRVLAFSRPGPTRMEPLDINARIREAASMARLSLQKAGAHVAVAVAEDLPHVKGDLRLLEQVVLNLLTNAAQTLEATDGEKAIAVASALENGYVLITVVDSGPGVPPHLREKIFDPFFTTKKEGTGIGLSLTHRIVTDHGGFIRVGQSRLGGALFTIGLPVSD